MPGSAGSACVKSIRDTAAASIVIQTRVSGKAAPRGLVAIGSVSSCEYAAVAQSASNAARADGLRYDSGDTAFGFVRPSFFEKSFTWKCVIAHVTEDVPIICVCTPAVPSA